MLIISSCTILLFSIKGFDESSLRIAIRYTAKFAVTLFAIAFVASSLYFLYKSSATHFLKNNRKLIGLTFGTFHFSHLFFLGLLQMVFHPVFSLAKTTSLLAGGIAYFFILVMMITSFPKVQKRFKPWRILHAIGSYWIWAIFFNSYLKNVINKERYYFFFILLVAVLLIRLYTKVKGRRNLISS